jgi:hypothetical protein
MATMDQAVWANVNVSVGGEHQAFARGALLPEPATAEEASERNLLRLGGALRTVEVVYTAEELADMARQRGESTATREAALDVDPAAPSGDQMAGTATAGVATMVEPSGAPVVIGNEEMRAEHEKAAKAAQRPAAKAPADKDTAKDGPKAASHGVTSGHGPVSGSKS